jgi:hypothetical protein
MTPGLLLWPLWLAAPASEEAWAGVPVRIDACVDARGVDREQLAYLVGNELEGPAAAITARLGEEGASFVLGCSEDGVVARLEGPTTAEAEVRTEGLEKAVATRTIALAIVEMVTELPEVAAEPVEAEPVVEPEPEPEPEPVMEPEPEPGPVEASQVPPTRWVLRAGFEALGFPLASLGLYGIALDVRHRSARRFGWMAAVSAHGGRDREALGLVQAMSASGLLAATIHGERERFAAYGALGARGGIAALRGVAEGDGVLAGSVLGGWLGPAARGGIDGFVGRNGVIGGHLELGWAALGTQARVDGRPGAGTTGLWIGAGVSVGWRVPGSR